MKKRHLQTNFLKFLVEKYEEEIQVLKDKSESEFDNEDFDTDSDELNNDEVKNKKTKDENLPSTNFIKELTLEYKNNRGKL